GDDVAHDPFGLAVGVALGVVEEVDAVVPRGRDEFARRAAADLGTEREPRAERQCGQLQAGRTEAAVLHGRTPGGNDRSVSPGSSPIAAGGSLQRPAARTMGGLFPPGSSPPAQRAGTCINTLGRQAVV